MCVNNADVVRVHEADKAAYGSHVQAAAAFQLDAADVRRYEGAEGAFGARRAKIRRVAVRRQMISQVDGNVFGAADIQRVDHVHHTDAGARIDGEEL